MPAFSVSIDGAMLATVCTDGFDVLNVRASGTRIDDHLADLDISGGSYPENGNHTHLIWVNDLQLHLGQVITVSFLDHASSSHTGKTIDELFPDEEPTTDTDFKPTAEIFTELRKKPMLRDKFSFRLESSSGNTFAGETAPDAHGFGFSILWNSYHPERARVSLHSYTLDGLESRGPMSNHFEERLNFGSSVRFELIA
jgi:hypothetical protein